MTTPYIAAPTKVIAAAGTRFAYRDAGHGGIFQHHTEFLPKALAFLAA